MGILCFPSLAPSRSGCRLPLLADGHLVEVSAAQANLPPAPSVEAPAAGDLRPQIGPIGRVLAQAAQYQRIVR
jgi:hypothetical protein